MNFYYEDHIMPPTGRQSDGALSQTREEVPAKPNVLRFSHFQDYSRETEGSHAMTF